MHLHEEALIRAFISSHRQARWLESLGSVKRRARFLDRLNHCRDFDERYARGLPSNADVVSILKECGAPAACRVVSAAPSLDAQDMGLEEAVEAATQSGWGTVLSCLPGQLAYYHDECGERRFLLERKPETPANGGICFRR